MYNWNMVRDFIICVLVVGMFSGATIAIALYYLLPWAWTLIKPVIQALVA